MRMTWPLRCCVLMMILGLSASLITLPSLLTTTAIVFAADTAEPLALNTATADQLKALPGIGAARAEAIILDRVRRGPFRTIEDLDRVDGVGPATIEALRPFVKPARSAPSSTAR